MAAKANRAGGAERFDAAAVPKTIAVALALIPSYDELLKDLARSSLKTAKPPEAHTLYLRPTVPGIGKILSLVRLYAMHDLRRLPRVQDVASSCRLVKGSQAAGGQRWGTSGKQSANAPLKWAFAEAATLFLRHNEPGQQLRARVEQKPDTGKALSLLAHQLGRAVSCMLTRTVAFAMKRVLQPSGSRAGEPSASLDAAGMSLYRACAQPGPAASVNAKARLEH
jgi:transposase